MLVFSFHIMLEVMLAQSTQAYSRPVSVLCYIGDFGRGDGGWTIEIKFVH